MGVASADKATVAYPAVSALIRLADLQILNLPPFASDAGHRKVVENYREGHRLAQASANGESDSTEDLRQAMRRYRALFDELLETDADEAMARDRDGSEQLTDADREQMARKAR